MCLSKETILLALSPNYSHSIVGECQKQLLLRLPDNSGASVGYALQIYLWVEIPQQGNGGKKRSL